MNEKISVPKAVLDALKLENLMKTYTFISSDSIGIALLKTEQEY